MNCKHVQELLPLFTGRDLDEKRATLVAAHMQSCMACAASAREYRESQQLLQQFAPPQFSEALYSGIRQRVLLEINDEPPAPTLAESIANLFSPRDRWAIATALLLAISGLAFYLIATRTNPPQNVSHRDTTASPSPAPRNDPTRGAEDPGTVRITIGTPPVIHQPKRGRKSVLSAGRDRLPAVDLAVNTRDLRAPASPASPQLNNLAGSNVIPAPAVAGSEKPLRVDLQTRNQNIRIIWFTPQPTKRDSPGKSSKRNQEASSHV